MAIHVALHHRTTYRYTRPVTLGPQVVRLRPAPHARTRIISYSQRVEPRKQFCNWQQDPFGNWQARLVFPERTTIFQIEVDLVAEMAVVNPFDFFLEPEAERFPFVYEPGLCKDLAPYLEAEPAGPALRQLLAEIPRTARPTVEFLVGLNQDLQRRIGYVIRMEPGVQDCETTLQTARGSCRDSGWLLVQILRHLGLAARFVSGYLVQLAPDVKPLDGPAGPDTDLTDLHAWAEVYLPGAGWVGLDPTSGLLAGEGHIPLAATPEPETAAPVTGLVEPAEVAFDVAMSVRRLVEPPRVTRPYDDVQWRAILAAGDRVDARLVQGDVRLTVGGEPTFVSIDDMDGAEWNTAAVGPAKRRLGEALIHRLRRRFAPGGVLHFGQGKWYPGEQLPRWALSLLWRRDGEPLWRDPALLVGPNDSGGHGQGDAARFIGQLAERLGVSADHAIPAFEDPAVFLLKEQTLPINVDPLDNRLDDAEERARLARVFERGLGKPIGWVLPLQRWQARATGGRWRSERWRLRRERLFAVPGDSPLGLRLPLGSLPWISREAWPHVIPIDPFAERGPLPPAAQLHQPRVALPDPGPRSPAPSDTTAVRTALTVEPRDGRLCVFLPPCESADDFAELLAAIETTVAELGLPVQLEGYLPPHDPRLGTIKVTPDPGVLEVNIHPARTWREAVEITEALYEEARQARLGTEKFMLDGRHTGTGGGNHVVMGGENPVDSPFLRRPDLLASLLGCWQNHPSLSYLFSGLFIGPTSQAPRIDEARHDQLHELEIAFEQVLRQGRLPPPPWLVDRIFRNLLIDVTGNTHRAEICIDKLYSPDGAAGRLGLVEFRAFEMPPHPQMSLAQQLLLRALVVRYWERPWRGRLVRWGTALHDRFMLPAFIRADLGEVLDDLAAHELPLDPAWFEPHIEFRFPVLGDLDLDGIHLELRQALEPWHVMGEEGAIGGTVRYVDSSLERLQVRVSGIVPERHVVTVNGHALPLASTGRRDELVAGVRFRAWQPPSCLHPTIPVHAPLVIDVVDRWNRRSLGGCTYHVMHPGGRNYDTFPVNAYEAEARRLARFERQGHTPGEVEPPPVQVDPEFPLTLDLRRYSAASGSG